MIINFIKINKLEFLLALLHLDLVTFNESRLMYSMYMYRYLYNISVVFTSGYI